MIEWNDINEKPLPSDRVTVLAIHRSKYYTSDVYMVWKSQDGEIARWPFGDSRDVNITHWAYYNLPEIGV